jgi:putative ABC transport system permease protein
LVGVRDTPAPPIDPAGSKAGEPAAPAPVKVHYVRPQGLDGITAEIIGVYSSDDFGLAGRRFQAPLALGKRLLHASGFDRAFGRTAPGLYRALTVKVESREDVPGLREQIERKGFDTFAVADILKIINIVFAVLEVILSFFGGIGLVVSFFGIANTMVMAVLERTREIGVLKALGARDRDVRRIFLAEAGSIGLTGGAVGVLAGWIIGQGLNTLGSYLMREALSGRAVSVFYVPPWLAGTAILVSFVVATVAGLYPAWRAARLDPVVSLRME